MQQQQQQPSAEWPVVLHESFRESEIERCFSQFQSQGIRFRVKTTKALSPCSVVFPLSSVAFIVVHLDQVLMEWMEKEVRVTPEISERLNRFADNHRNAHVLGLAAIHGPQEKQALSELQSKFFETHLSFLPVHNASESVSVMINIAKVTCKPLSGIVRQRYEQFVERQCSESTLLNIISQVGIDMHDCFVLTDGCGCLADVASASREHLIDCTLEPASADTVVTFFGEDVIIA